MFRRSLIAWKLSALFVAIILLVFFALGWVSNLMDEHSSVADARDVSRFNAETIVKSLQRLMMMRDNEGIAELIAELARDNPIYRELRLASHDGRVVASRAGLGGQDLPLDSWACQACHAHNPPDSPSLLESRDRIVATGDGPRVVSVVTPIVNQKSCQSAACHAHSDSNKVLGLLQTDYSLERVDQSIARRDLQALIAVAAAVLLGTIGTWFAVGRILERPIRILIHGMRRIAEGDLTFRFKVRRRDEFALVAETFNRMTARLQNSTQEIRETKDYLQGIVENSADMIITVDPAGKIKTFNRGAERILGYAREEVIGREMEELFVCPEDRRRAIAKLGRLESVINYETQFVTKGGDVRDVIVTLSLLRGPEGVALGTMGISKDVTMEKHLQQQLVRAERFAAIGYAVTNIQHSLKNMLNALTGGGYMVRVGLKKKDLDMIMEGWDMVDEGIADMTRLSRGMLGFVRESKLDLRWIDPGDVLRRIESLLARADQERGVSFRMELSDDLPKILCDPELVHSVMMDLVSNALDACSWKEYPAGDRPAVVVRSTFLADTRRVVLEVRDNGMGMTEDVSTRIFTPFFSTKKRKGTGLGLALASRLVNAHDGSIEVISEPGHGTVFQVFLPVCGPKSEEVENGKESSDNR